MSLILARLLIFLFFFSAAHVSLANIWIKNKEVDLGKIIQGKTISYAFQIKNNGSKPVTIKKVSPS